MKNGTAIEKKQKRLAPKNFIKFAENYALLYRVFLQRFHVFWLPDSAQSNFCSRRIRKGSFYDFKKRN